MRSGGRKKWKSSFERLQASVPRRISEMKTQKRLHYLLILTRFQCTKSIFFFTQLPSFLLLMPFFFLLFSSVLCLRIYTHSLFTQFQSPESSNDRLFVFFSYAYFCLLFNLLVRLPFFFYSQKRTEEHVGKFKTILHQINGISNRGGNLSDVHVLRAKTNLQGITDSDSQKCLGEKKARMR